MDPAEYDEAAYRAELRHKLQESEARVLQATFVPAWAAAGQTILLAATSTGFVHVYLLTKLLRAEYWDQASCSEVTAAPGPTLSFQAHPAQIYSLRFAGDAANPLVISGGDQDFRVWSWTDILAAAESVATGATSSSTRAKKLTPVHVGQLERRTLGYRSALLPASEINDVAVSNTTGHLFLAGGDGAGHEWDLKTQQVVRRFDGHDDYLHAVRHLQQSQELVTGSEDGTLGIWDVRQSTKVEFLHPQPMSTKSTSSQSFWVGAVVHDPSEVWLACGGGKKRTARGQHAGISGGFLSMWHLPSRVPVHYTETFSDVHDVAFHHMELLSVGNDASLKTWNRSSGQLLATAHSTLPSCYFCVVDEVTDIIAVGGVLPVIDIYTMPGVVSFSLVVQVAQ